MGYATTRTLERMLAAVPALLAQGLRRRPRSYQLPQGFYGIDSIFWVLALMALARIRSFPMEFPPQQRGDG